MKVNPKWFNLAPNTLNEDEFTVLNILLGKAVLNGGEPKATFQIKQGEFETLFGYGRDKTDKVLTSLVEKKFITREQKRNPDGTFSVNDVKIITNLIG